MRRLQVNALRSVARIPVDTALSVLSSRMEYQMDHSHTKSSLNREAWVWSRSRGANEDFDPWSIVVPKGIGFTEGTRLE